MSGSADSLQAVQVRIYGRVQGVWFRAWTEQAATALELGGWVRNRTDGCVEALFVGPADDIESMVAKCLEGPLAARVDEVVREVPSTPPEAEIRAAGFQQLPTL